MIFHGLNRGNARRAVFEKEQDYEAFEEIIQEAVERCGVDLLDWCLMPYRWHLVAKSQTDGKLSCVVGWFSL